MPYFANAMVLLVQAIFGLLLFLIVIRVLLQAVRANFYNPICQAMYKATNPVLMPLGKVLPTWRGLNLAGVTIAWLVACAWVLSLSAFGALAGRPGPLGIVVLGLAQLIGFTLQTLFWITIVRVLLSWLAGESPNPAVPLIYRISDLILKPFQRIIPPLGGFDLSPLFGLLAVQLAQILVVAPLWAWGRTL